MPRCKRNRTGICVFSRDSLGGDDLQVLSTIVAVSPVVEVILGGLRMFERELLLFAGFWFVLGIADEIAIDCLWLWQRLVNKRRTHRLVPDLENRVLIGHALANAAVPIITVIGIGIALLIGGVVVVVLGAKKK